MRKKSILMIRLQMRLWIRSRKNSLMEEIELLDGASAEFDQEAGKQRRAVTGIFRFCSDKLWCGDIPGAFPEDDTSPLPRMSDRV